MKPSLNEAKLTGFWAGNCGTIQQVLISKFVFGPEKISGLSRNAPQVREAKAKPSFHWCQENPLKLGNLLFPDPNVPDFPSSETQGQIMGTRESLNGRENIARRKVLFFVRYFSARLDFPSFPLSAPGSPRMQTFQNNENSWCVIVWDIGDKLGESGLFLFFQRVPESAILR